MKLTFVVYAHSHGNSKSQFHKENTAFILNAPTKKEIFKYFSKLSSSMSPPKRKLSNTFQQVNGTNSNNKTRTMQYEQENISIGKSFMLATNSKEVTKEQLYLIDQQH